MRDNMLLRRRGWGLLTVGMLLVSTGGCMAGAANAPALTPVPGAIAYEATPMDSVVVVESDTIPAGYAPLLMSRPLRLTAAQHAALLSDFRATAALNGGTAIYVARGGLRGGARRYTIARDPVAGARLSGYLRRMLGNTVASPSPARTPPAAPPATGGSGGSVNVRGYTRKDGTYVRPHTRRAPRSSGRRP